MENKPEMVNSQSFNSSFVESSSEKGQQNSSSVYFNNFVYQEHEPCIQLAGTPSSQYLNSSRSPLQSRPLIKWQNLLPPSITSIGILWTTISIVLAILSGFSLVASTWVLQYPDSDQNGFGPLKSCHLSMESNLDFVQKCQYFILDNGVMNWPSSPFQVTALLYSVGMFFLMIASCFAVTSLVTLSAWRLRFIWLAGYFQLSAVLVQAFALAIFPMGFNSAFAQGFCGSDTSMYNMGSCHLGWGYVLAIVTTSLVVFCPFLSKVSTKSTKRSTFGDNEGLSSTLPIHLPPSHDV